MLWHSVLDIFPMVTLGIWQAIQSLLETAGQKLMVFKVKKMQSSLVDFRKKPVLLFSLQKVTTILPTLWPEVSALCASRNWLKGNVRTGGTWILPPSTQVFSCDKYFSPVSISSEKKLLKHDNLNIVESYMIYSISTYIYIIYHDTSKQFRLTPMWSSTLSLSIIFVPVFQVEVSPCVKPYEIM